MTGLRLAAQIDAVERKHCALAIDPHRAIGLQPATTDRRGSRFAPKRTDFSVLKAYFLNNTKRPDDQNPSPNQAFHDSIRPARVIMP
jgi:hypothetical protein